MYLSKKHGFIYLPTSKSGSHSITKVCIDVFGAEPMTPRDLGENNYTGFCGAEHSVFIPLEYKDFYTFSSVRNPYTREISKYNWMRRKPNPITRNVILEKKGSLDFTSYISWICDNEITRCWDNNVWKESQVDTLYRQPVPRKCKKVDQINKTLKCEALALDFKSLPFVKKGHQSYIDAIFNKRLNSCRSQTDAIFHFEKRAKDMFCNRFMEDFITFKYDIEDCPSVPKSIKHM